MSCATCGRRLPLDSWSLGVCAEDCLDAFVDAHLAPRASAPARARPAAWPAASA